MPSRKDNNSLQKTLLVAPGKLAERIKDASRRAPCVGSVPDAEAKLMIVTPALAVEWLERNTRNRNISDATVEEFAGMMKHGEWHLSNDAITFDREGNLINGQHRLWALIDANVSAQFLVMRGASDRAKLVMDRGRKRNQADQLRLLHGWDVSSSTVAIARAMMRGVKADPRVGRDVFSIEQFLIRYSRAIQFAKESFNSSKRGVASAVVKAVVGRAWFTQDRERVRQFAQVVVKGLPISDSDHGALLFRAWVGDNMQDLGGGGIRTSLAVYARAERGLRAFLDREEIQVLRAAPEELFPLPEELSVRQKRDQLHPDVFDLATSEDSSRATVAA